MFRPLIGIPMGDPSGIGPEIIIKALNHKELYDLCRPLVIGDIGVVDKIKGLTGNSSKLNVIEGPASGIYKYGIIDIIPINNIDSMKLAFGRVQAEAGKAAFEYIAKVVELAKNKEVDAIATTPINKEALRLANIDFIGHTEILSGLTGTDDPLTMFQVYNMRVFFLSRHLSLIKACEAVKKERIIDYVIRCTEALRRLGLPNPSIAIAGLNPHSGEHGLFGDEEVTEIEPAVRELKSNGYNITGPVSADSVFYQARIGKYDAVLSLYHDQGHIATKTVDFERTISLTIGMPFLRTSVDHGTAFDIAGKGIASEVSMVEAIRLAAEYADKYNG